MKVKDLIKILEKCPKDLPVLINADDLDDNYLGNVYSVEVSETGESGYEIGGEVRLNAFI